MLKSQNAFIIILNKRIYSETLLFILYFVPPKSRAANCCTAKPAKNETLQRRPSAALDACRDAAAGLWSPGRDSVAPARSVRTVQRHFFCA